MVIKWLDRFFKRKQQKAAQQGGYKMTIAEAEKMLVMIQKTQETELSCDDVHELLDQYAEMKLRGEDASALLPLIRFHLDMCPDCREEYEALMRILRAQA